MSEIDPLSLRPLGGHLVVKRVAPPKTFGSLALPEMASGRRTCKTCKGKGCFVEPIYEEDGIWIAKHREHPCPKCNGLGFHQAVYDPREKLREQKAVVISVGPGAQRAKRNFSDKRVIYYKEGRHPLDVKPGDTVLLAKWAGWSGMSFFLDDDYLVVNDFEVLAVLESSDSE